MLSPIWQPDSDVTQCPLCDQEFTFTFRRHHCRCCGRVVCHHCLANNICYPSTMMVATLTGPMTSQLWDKYRSCDSCKSDLERLPPPPTTLTSLLSMPRRVDDGDNLCPVCAKNLRILHLQTAPKIELEQFKEGHIAKCLAGYDFSKSPERTSQILVYNIPPIPQPQYQLIDATTTNGPPLPTEKTLDTECVICLEELEPGDKVGRLECLCVFHYKCIKDWFNKRGYGQCPVHIH